MDSSSRDNMVSRSIISTCLKFVTVLTSDEADIKRCFCFGQRCANCKKKVIFRIIEMRMISDA